MLTRAEAVTWNDLKTLPPEHVQYFFNNNKAVKEKCKADSNCPYKVRSLVSHTILYARWKFFVRIVVYSLLQESVFSDRCWGYEDECEASNRMLKNECPESSNRWYIQMLISDTMLVM